ncbi:MAG: NfeD family protein [Candidatus Zixiibacteriota bacterium]
MILFATIFGVGFLLLISSLIFGGDDVDADVDGDFDHGFDHGPSIFSLKMISLLMVGFGAMAFGIRATTDATMFIASMSGIGGAIVVGIIGYLIIRAMYMSQANSTIGNQDIIGASGTLIDAVPAGGRGQVACIIQGREVTFVAMNVEDGEAIPKSTPVKIVSRIGNSVKVQKL